MRPSIPTLALGLAALPALAQAPDLLQALQKGQVSLALRTRYEHVQDDVTGKGADAFTNRFTLGYRTLAWNGVSAFAEFENVANLAAPRFFVPQTGYGRPDHAVVADPPVSQLNQLYLEGYGLKVGRQTVNFGNQRFVGSVGWRQNDQTFTGATFANRTWIPGLAFTLGHLTQIQTITGTTRTLSANLVDTDATWIPGAHLRLFHYTFEETTAPATSLAHTGARLDGQAWRIRYDLSFAKQKPTADATTATIPEADYRYLGLGFQVLPRLTVTAARETLGAGFRTPYATLHAWNGWVDRFLTTPANGLVDTLGRVQGEAGRFQVEAVYHAFKAETGSAAYGTEWDASVGFKAQAWLSLLVKAGDYRGDAAAPGALAKDQRKVWLQSVMTF